MENTMLLSPDESTILDVVCENGTGCITGNDQIDLLIQGLLKVGVQTYNTVMDAVKEDKTLCKTIAKRMHDLTESAVEANNAAMQSAIDTYKANSEAIRQFMNNPEGREFTIAECFAELRYYAEKIEKAQQENLAANKKMLDEHNAADNETLARSKKNRDVAIGAGIALGGIGIAGGIWLLVKQITKK